MRSPESLGLQAKEITHPARKGCRGRDFTLLRVTAVSLKLIIGNKKLLVLVVTGLAVF